MKKAYIRFVSHWIGSFVLVWPLQAAEVLTLQEALQRGIQHDLELQQAQQAHQQKTRQPRLDLLKVVLPKPTVQATGSIGPSPASVGIELGSLTWNVKQFVQRLCTKTHQQTIALSALTIQDQLAKTVRELTEAYYQVVIAQQKQQLADQVLQIAREKVQYATELYAVGISPPADYTKAQTAYQQAHVTWLQEQEQYKNPQRQLNIRLGREPEEALVVTATIPLNKTIHMSPESIGTTPEVLMYKKR